MTGLIRQYRTEIRNILILALVIIALPYLPALAGAMVTPVGIITTMAVAGSVVLAMTLKVYFRILVMRIDNDNKAGI